DPDRDDDDPPRGRGVRGSGPHRLQPPGHLQLRHVLLPRAVHVLRGHQADAAAGARRAAGLPVLPRGLGQAGDGARPAAVRRGGDVRLRPQHPGPRRHRQPRVHALRAAAVLAVLLHPAQQPLRVRPGAAVPDVLADRLRPRAGAHRVAGLQRRRHPEARRGRLPQAADRARRRPGLHAAAAGPAGVLLQHRRASLHARTAVVRQHVRRPPAADPLRARRGVPAPARQRAGQARRGADLAALLRDRRARAARAVPAGLHLHDPDLALHLQRHRRGAL
ncbi:MAG: ATP synthase F0 sector subunit a, partial [uncultured Nocardioidaceae bacterium]